MASDEERFEELYRRHESAIRSYCRRRLDVERVDDAFADVFAIAWRRIEDIPAGEGELPWLYGVARNVVLHQWRSKVRRRRVDHRHLGLVAASPEQPDSIVLARQEERLVLEAATRLKPIDREILSLSLWEELDHADVASVLGLEPTAVRKRLSRAKANLTKEFNRLEQRSQTPAAQRGGAQ